MGYIKHHAIVVTGYNDLVQKAHGKAMDLFDWRMVSEIRPEVVNGYRSFFIAPDGSKEFWETSNVNDGKRSQFIQFIESLAYEDGSNSLRYAELFFGEDNGEAEMLRHN